MVIKSLYHGPYLKFFIKNTNYSIPKVCKYEDINWRDEWYTFLKLASKDRTSSINKVLAWFDENILQAMDINCYPEPKLKTTISTLNVRIRIICGMINNISHLTLSREMKIVFMECIWDTYKKFRYLYLESYYREALQLPF